MCSTDIFLGILALLFPPLPVWVKCGICSADSIINILLCVLGYIPGLLHAWYIIAKFPEPDYEYEQLPRDSERGRITYVIVHEGEDGRRHEHSGQVGGRQQQQQGKQPSRQGNMSYGTASNNNNNNNNNNTANNAPAPSAPAAANDNPAGEGGSDGAPPPSYAQVVAGDKKVQSQD